MTAIQSVTVIKFCYSDSSKSNFVDFLTHFERFHVEACLLRIYEFRTAILRLSLLKPWNLKIQKCFL